MLPPPVATWMLAFEIQSRTHLRRFQRILFVKWPTDTDFALWELDLLDRGCPICGHMMYICDHRYRYIRYQVMLAARQQDPELLRRQYESVDELILTIDGLQPEKGHETHYVVRELTRKRVWFAEALISATADEVRRLITKAKEWAESLDNRSRFGFRISRTRS
jgi:hypothetical protein